MNLFNRDEWGWIWSSDEQKFIRAMIGCVKKRYNKSNERSHQSFI